jgi:hypothetical protein
VAEILEEREPLERAVALAPVEKVRGRRIVARRLRVELEEPNEAIGLGVRERSEEHAVHDAEDRGRRANAEPECQDRDERERRRPAQLSGSEREIMLKFVPQIRSAPVALDPALVRAQREPRAIDVAELAAGAVTRLVRRNAFGHELGRDHVDMERELVVDLAIDLAIGATREAEQAAEPGDASHTGTSVVWGDSTHIVRGTVQQCGGGVNSAGTDRSPLRRRQRTNVGGRHSGAEERASFSSSAAICRFRTITTNTRITPATSSAAIRSS